jgi:alpha-aminoadipate carrier protein LysW
VHCRDRACRAEFWHVTSPIANPFVTRCEDTMATCPECDAEMEVDEFDVDKGDQLSCPECGSNLEVVGLSPLELDLAVDDDDDEDPDADEEKEGEAGDDDEDDDDEDDDEDEDEVE